MPRIANSPAHSSKGTPSQLPKEPLRLIVSTRFQVLFHSPPGVLFTFPSRYLSAIGHQGVFRLSGWSRQIHTGFLGPRATWVLCTGVAVLRLRGCHPLRRAIQCPSTSTTISYSWPARQNWQVQPHNPACATPAGYRTHAVWPLPLSLATTHGITCCFLFQWVLRCFTSPRSLRHPMCSGGGDGT